MWEHTRAAVIKLARAAPRPRGSSIAHGRKAVRARSAILDKTLALSLFFFATVFENPVGARSAQVRSSHATEFQDAVYNRPGGYSIWFAICTTMPLVPGRSGLLTPSRSPRWGITLPDLDTRAATTTSAKSESFADGFMAIESSNENARGRSLTLTRTAASGMRPPCAGRASTNTVSSGAARAASAGASLTVPLTRAAFAVATDD